jgi:putative thioredoxin
VLLAIVERDRGQNRDAARKAMLMIFGLLGDAHPLTAQYRKQLMMALY